MSDLVNAAINNILGTQFAYEPPHMHITWHADGPPTIKRLHDQTIVFNNGDERVQVQGFDTPEEAFAAAFRMATHGKHGMKRPKWWQFWKTDEEAHFKRHDAIERQKLSEEET